MNKLIFVVICLITIRYAAAMDGQNLKINFKKYHPAATSNVVPKKIKIKFNSIQEEQDAEIGDSEIGESVASLATPTQIVDKIEDQRQWPNDDDLYDSEDNEPVVSRTLQHEGRGQKRPGEDLISQVPAKRKKSTLSANSPILSRLQEMVLIRYPRQEIIDELEIESQTLKGYLASAREFNFLTKDDCLYLEETDELLPHIVTKIKNKEPLDEILNEHKISGKHFQTITSRAYGRGQLNTTETLYLKPRNSAKDRPGRTRQKIADFINESAEYGQVSKTKKELYERFKASKHKAIGNITIQCFSEHMENLIKDQSLPHETIDFYRRCCRSAKQSY